MKENLTSYNLFFRFIDDYSPAGFRGINRNDSLICELEKLTETNNQFFHVADLILMQILWASQRSEQMIGIKPEELNAFHFFEATHPDDVAKHTLGRSKMMNLANDLYQAKNGKAFLSINLRIRNSKGEYPDLLFQLYFFYSEIHKTVFLFQVHTNIESFKKRKQGYHYYAGDNISNFRYPDEDLLMIGNPLSDREFEVVKLIAEGFTSEQIADKIFLSVHTVNTHRRNILAKTGRQTISEVIYNFQKIRLL